MVVNLLAHHAPILQSLRFLWEDYDRFCKKVTKVFSERGNSVVLAGGT